MIPAQLFGKAHSGQTKAFSSGSLGLSPHIRNIRSWKSLGLPGTRPAGRRNLLKSARAESIESVRGDHDPGPFVTKAPRNATVSTVPAADRKKLTLPTILTLLRLTSLPIITAVWFKKPEPAGALVASIFLIASATDYVDGYIARKMRLKTALGAFLDPVVDKLVVATVLVLIASKPVPAGPFAGNTVIFPVIAALIISREITMSAVREWAATLGKKAYRSVQVSDWGKYKTAIQMVGITLVLYAVKAAQTEAAEKAIVFGLPLLGVATVITLGSLADYLRKLWAAL